MKVDLGWGVRAASAVLAGLVACSLASAGSFTYDEAVDGDLSDDWLAPTQFPAFGVGQSVVTMSVVNSDDAELGDRDYFTITIPEGFELLSLDLLALDAGGGDNVAFLGIQEGDQVTVDPNFPNPEPLLGWILTQQSNVGTDIQELLVGTENAPLGPGQYSFWVQQTGQDLTTLSLGFEVGIIPSPGALGLCGLAMFGAMRRRR